MEKNRIVFISHDVVFARSGAPYHDTRTMLEHLSKTKHIIVLLSNQESFYKDQLKYIDRVMTIEEAIESLGEANHNIFVSDKMEELKQSPLIVENYFIMEGDDINLYDEAKEMDKDGVKYCCGVFRAFTEIINQVIFKER